VVKLVDQISDSLASRGPWAALLVRQCVAHFVCNRRFLEIAALGKKCLNPANWSQQLLASLEPTCRDCGASRTSNLLRCARPLLP
jgi:hypothetical protein